MDMVINRVGKSSSIFLRRVLPQVAQAKLAHVVRSQVNLHVIAKPSCDKGMNGKFLKWS